MDYLFYLLMFVFVYYVYYFFIIKRKGKLEKFKTSVEVKYLEGKYKIDLKKHNFESVVKKIALANSFIITVALFIVQYIDNLIMKIMVSFVVLIILQLSVYHILGKILKKEEKNV